MASYRAVKDEAKRNYTKRFPTMAMYELNRHLFLATSPSSGSVNGRSSCWQRLFGFRAVGLQGVKLSAWLWHICGSRCPHLQHMEGFNLPTML